MTETHSRTNTPRAMHANFTYNTVRYTVEGDANGIEFVEVEITGRRITPFFLEDTDLGRAAESALSEELDRRLIAALKNHPGPGPFGSPCRPILGLSEEEQASRALLAVFGPRVLAPVGLEHHGPGNALR